MKGPRSYPIMPTLQGASNSVYCITYTWLGMQIYATIMSGSIAIAASTLDSLLDLLVGGILWCTHWTVKNVNIYKYPIGKLRVQPVGIIIFAAVMATLGMRSPKLNLFLDCSLIVIVNCSEIAMYTPSSICLQCFRCWLKQYKSWVKMKSPQRWVQSNWHGCTRSWLVPLLSNLVSGFAAEAQETRLVRACAKVN